MRITVKFDDAAVIAGLLQELVDTCRQERGMELTGSIEIDVGECRSVLARLQEELLLARLQEELSR